MKLVLDSVFEAGGGYGDGAQHSQCLWGTFAHLPGMKVVVPFNPYDAKSLMTTAIDSDDPVVFMFHKGVMGLGWMAKNKRSIGAVPEDEYIMPIGKARVAREGTDVTPVGPTDIAPRSHEWLVGLAALAWADFGHT